MADTVLLDTSACFALLEDDAGADVVEAKLKAAHKVSFADAFVAATALRLSATLLHKDPEFDTLQGVVKLQALPLKTSICQRCGSDTGGRQPTKGRSLDWWWG